MTRAPPRWDMADRRQVHVPRSCLYPVSQRFRIPFVSGLPLALPSWGGRSPSWADRRPETGEGCLGT